MTPNKCPRCGKPYTRLRRKRVRGRVYVYARHYLGYSKVGGRIVKKYRECYLGPENGYVYVTRSHLREGLELKGMHEPRRILAYLKALVSAVEEQGLGESERAFIARLLEDAARRLKADNNEGIRS